ncbi:hypothetical protein SAMN05216188_13160 [Lentzea xinjiangensis]|uniref:Uncharacterized protein n=1 Tax=Lentzea xinjiangensis TaxID=402600 RepID=A0A1H9W8K2_9PSEU|nr:hypothetical protein [Lentzea xinjiangensis]SES30260.1 hypothetical protein SAMN05216188_13160 [Lentzea xinjiangensis]
MITAARAYVVTVPCDAGGIGGDHERFTRAVSVATSGAPLQVEKLTEIVAKVGAAHDIAIVGPPLRVPVTPSSAWHKLARTRYYRPQTRGNS